MTFGQGRLLFWTDCFWPTIGGSEIWSRSIVKALQGRGWRILVVAFDNESAGTSEETSDGIEIIRPPMRRGIATSDAAVIRQAATAVTAAVDRFLPDCIQIVGQRAETLFAHSLTIRKRRLPTLLTFHAEWPTDQTGTGSLIDRIVAAADQISVFDESMIRWASQRWPAWDGRIVSIPHALIRPARSWRAPPANSLIAYCGRLSLEKGVDIAIAAFARVLARHPAARLIIAGDGDQRLALESQARELGIDAAVSFLGWVDPGDVERILDDCAFAILPSRLESFGLFALEAAARGRAIIASNTGGLPNQIDDGETGLLTPPGNHAELAAAMLSLLSDPSRAARLGAAGRAKVERRLDWPTHVAAVEALLDRTRRRRPGAS